MMMVMMKMVVMIMVTMIVRMVRVMQQHIRSLPRNEASTAEDVERLG